MAAADSDVLRHCDLNDLCDSGHCDGGLEPLATSKYYDQRSLSKKVATKYQ